MRPRLYSSLVILIATAALSVNLPLSAAVKDACSVFAQADAESALGEPVGPPRSESRPSGAGETPVCKYRSAHGGALSAKTISLTIHYGADGLKDKMGAIAEAEKSAGYKNVQQVSGVGDGAVWGLTSLIGKTSGELTVRKGDSTMLVIIISGLPDEATARERAKTVASKVLPKI